MKNIKTVLVGSFVLGTLLFIGIQLYGMKPIEFSIKSRSHRAQPVQQEKQPRYKSDIVWVKTSDNVLMEIPQWQIDQMKSIQPTEKNSINNPANASTINSKQLILIQQALQNAGNLEEFRLFYISLSDDQQKSLLADAFTLGMQGLASLLIAYMFPLDLQEQMGASALQQVNIIAPVIKYLMEKNPIKTPLTGHTERVKCVAYSPDGNYIVSGAMGDENNLLLWNGKTGEQIKILKGHTRGVTCVAYSPDGNYIVSGGSDKKLILWNGKTGDLIKILEGHNLPLICVAYSPDGNYIVSGAGGHYIITMDETPINLILWNGKTGEQIKKLQGHNKDNNNAVTAVAYSLDGNYIASGDNYGNLILWNGKTGEQINKSWEHYGEIHCVAYSPDNNYIVSGGSETQNNLILWNGKTGKKIKLLKGHRQWVRCVAYNPDGNYIVSGGDDKNLILWNGKTGEEIKILEGHKGYIDCVAYSPDGSYIVSGSLDRNLILWNGKTGDLIKIFEGHKLPITCIAYSPDSNCLVSGEGNTQGWRSTSPPNLILWKIIIPQNLYFIATNLNIAQARLLYRLYLATINNVEVILDQKDFDYQIFETLPKDIKQIIEIFLPFKESAPFIEQEIQQKMIQLKSLLFYTKSFFFGKNEKTLNEKIKAVKDTMLNFNKNTASYKACERLLNELEQEAAFAI